LIVFLNDDKLLKSTMEGGKLPNTGNMFCEKIASDIHVTFNETL